MGPPQFALSVCLAADGRGRATDIRVARGLPKYGATSYSIQHAKRPRRGLGPAARGPTVNDSYTPPSTTQFNTHNHYGDYWAAFFLRISANCFSRFALARSCSSMSRYFFGKG